ncbi:FAD-dependent oxidoreductase [bacterium]|nr:FAD-dependent oxidoreductase [candidate division CSSED10-310 bacterium]
MKPDVLVAGAGPAGLAAALEFTRRGRRVMLVDRATQPGGKTVDYCCKADDSCRYCGVCHADKAVAEALAHPGITMHAGTEIARVTAGDDGLEIRLNTGRDEMVVEVAQLVWAGGFQVGNGECEPRYGYGRLPGVITAFELESILLERDIPARPDGEEAASVAFIQCVGSRNRRLNAPWCSQVCCAYALRLANLLLHRRPALRVRLFHIDLQALSRTLRELAVARREVLVQGMPGGISRDDDGLSIHWDDKGVKRRSERFDLAVLSTGIRPGSLPDGLLEATGASLDQFGFIAPSEGNSRFTAAGTATGPMGIIAAMKHARSRVAELVSRGTNP